MFIIMSIVPVIGGMLFQLVCLGVMLTENGSHISHPLSDREVTVVGNVRVNPVVHSSSVIDYLDDAVIVTTASNDQGDAAGGLQLTDELHLIGGDKIRQPALDFQKILN